MNIISPILIDTFKDEYHLKKEIPLLKQFADFLNQDNEIIKRLYVPYTLYDLKNSVGNILSHEQTRLMSESIDEERYTYPPETTIKAMMEVHPTLTPAQFFQLERRNKIIVFMFVADVLNNINSIVTDMDKCGYYVANKKSVFINGRTWMQIAFEPYVTQNIINVIKDMSSIIHLTPTKNIESIKEKGIIPHAQPNGKLYNYPSRIYFMRGDLYPNQVRIFARELQKISNESQYSVCVIDTDLISDDMRFYYDPNEDDCFFTYQSIPSEWIIRYFDIQRYSPIID